MIYCMGNLIKSNAVKYSFIPPGQSYGCCMCTTYMCYIQYINSGNYYTQKQIIIIRTYIC